MKYLIPLTLGLALIATDARAALGEANFTAASFLGGANDSVRGARIQSDGSVVLAATVSAGPLLKQAGGDGDGKGMIVRLAPGGGKVLAMRRVAAEVRDLAIDAQDHIFVALGKEGALKLDRTATDEIWRRETGGLCARIDAASDGTCAALNHSRDNDTATGEGEVHVFAGDGRETSRFKTQGNTLDIAIDGASRTIVTIGWRQANAFDGKRRQPVQISHLVGRSYDGVEKYHLYDWSVDTNAPAFLNKPSNNMADTRGYRCAMGADGRLYAAFECAGGNHIFRYEPRLENGKWVEAKAKKARGDNFHAFHNSRAEHKTFMAIFDPATGAYVRGQEFTARLPNGRANAARVKNGAVAGGPGGGFLLAGPAAAELPVSFAPPGTGDYKGGGYLLAMTSDLNAREFCLRIQPGAEPHALDARKVGGKRIVVIGGQTSGKDDVFWTKNAIQPEAPPGSGFFCVIELPETK